MVTLATVFEGSDPLIRYFIPHWLRDSLIVFQRVFVLVELQGTLLYVCWSSAVSVLRPSDCAIVSLASR